MYAMNDNFEYGQVSAAMNREFALKIILPSRQQVSAIEMPVGRPGAAATVVVTIRTDVAGKPGDVLREGYKGVDQLMWQRFPFEPITLEANRNYWIGFKGVDHTHTGGTVISGPGQLIPPLTNSPEAETTEQFVLNNFWEGPYNAKPMLRLV